MHNAITARGRRRRIYYMLKRALPAQRQTIARRRFERFCAKKRERKERTKIERTEERKERRERKEITRIERKGEEGGKREKK